MKNIILSIAILISFNAYSQKIGVKYGFMLTKINHALYTGPQQSYNIGVLYNHKLSEVVSIQPEIIFSDKGGYYREANRSVSQKYVDFPLQAKFTMPKGSVRPYLMTGISPSLLVSNKESNDGFVFASKVNAAGIVSIGIDCKASEKMDVIFEARGWAGLDYQSFSFNFGIKF
jgi:hypothetical protein